MSTQSNDEKPREWWIQPSNEPELRTIHVIEYKAYSQLAERLAEAEANLEWCGSSPMFEVHEKLKAELESLRTQLAEKAKDLPIAHDTQPYPTAWAYEQVCRALDSLRIQMTEAEKNASMWKSRADTQGNRLANLNDAFELLRTQLVEAEGQNQELKSIVSGKTFSYSDEVESLRAQNEVLVKDLEAVKESHKRQCELNDKQWEEKKILIAQNEMMKKLLIQAEEMLIGISTQQKIKLSDFHSWNEALLDVERLGKK